jgi:hypothetical protein
MTVGRGPSGRTVRHIAQLRRTTRTDSSLPQCFIPHSPGHVCYDERTHAHGGRAPGREETGWILSR